MTAAEGRPDGVSEAKQMTKRIFSSGREAAESGYDIAETALGFGGSRCH